MTRDELRLACLDHFLGNTAEEYNKKVIQQALEENDGDIPKALQWFFHNDIHIGNCGFYASDMPSWSLWGGFTTAKMECWFPGRKANDKPDLLIPWDEIILYVKNGCPHDIQLELF